MNKKGIFIVLFAAVLVLGLSAQEQRMPGFRAELGFDIPFTFGAVLDGNSFEGADVFADYIFPFPAINANYMVPVGPFNLGGGLRGYTLILESFFWPNLVAELALGPVVVQAQFGGGLFLMFGLYNGAHSGAVFFPDLSVHYQLNKFRFGVGALGLFADELTSEAVPIVFYASAKFLFD